MSKNLTSAATDEDESCGCCNVAPEEERELEVLRLKSGLTSSMLALYDEHSVSHTQKCVVHPESTLRVSFDMVMGAFVMVEAILIPFTMSFNTEVPWRYDLVCTFVFFLDVCLNFCTGFYYHGNIVLRKRVIAYRYIKTTFWFDVIATVPWDYLLISTGGAEDSAKVHRLLKAARLTRSVRLLRLFKLQKLAKNLSLKEVMLSHHQASVLREAFMIFLFLSYFIHVVACGWRLVGDESPHSSIS